MGTPVCRPDLLVQSEQVVRVTIVPSHLGHGLTKVSRLPTHEDPVHDRTMIPIRTGLVYTGPFFPTFYVLYEERYGRTREVSQTVRTKVSTQGCRHRVGPRP